MARIRSIKPEFPQSETVGSLSRDARLLFIMLWTIVDDEGRARAASRMLASLLFPYDDDAPSLIDGWLDELEAAECIKRYEADGGRYLCLPNWLKHQKIDRASPSKLPAPDTNSSGPRESSRVLATDLEVDQDREGEEEVLVPSDDETKTGAQKRASFTDFYDPFFKDGTASRPKAEAAWKPLSEKDRLAAIGAVRGHNAYCAKHPTYTPISPANFLKERRFENYVGQSSGAPVPTEKIFPDTPEWAAWLAYKRDRGQRTSYMEAEGRAGAGFRVPSRFPPKQEAA